MNIITEAVVTTLQRVQDERSMEYYYRLKDTLLNEYGSDTALVSKLETLEQNPDDEKLQNLLDEALTNVGANNNERLIEIARMTLRIMEELGLEFSGTGTVRTTKYLKYEDAEDNW